MARGSKVATHDAESEPRPDDGARLVRLAAHVVSSYLAANRASAAEVPGMIGAVHSMLAQIGSGTTGSAEGALKPAVPIKKSVGDDHIVCLEDGKKLTMLKRYLKTHYNLTPDEYRKKWDLPHDYPMVAPAYARLRSSFAKKIGLGRIPTDRAKRRKSS